jgi:hypothetical protein
MFYVSCANRVGKFYGFDCTDLAEAIKIADSNVRRGLAVSAVVIERFLGYPVYSKQAS